MMADSDPLPTVLADPDPVAFVSAHPVVSAHAGPDPISSEVADPVVSGQAGPGQTMTDPGVRTRISLSPELIAAVVESFEVSFCPSFNRKVLIESIASLLSIEDMNHSHYQRIVLKTILKRVCQDYDDPSFQSMTAAHISHIVSNLFVPFTGLPMVLSSSIITVSRERIPIVISELPVVISSWNLKRLLLESQLFGSIILTNSIDIKEKDVFRYIIQSTYERLSLNLDDFYHAQVPKVKDRCRKIVNDLREMMEKLTKCCILPVVPLSPPPGQVESFWNAVSDVFCDDKKYLSLEWLRGKGKSVFLEHYIELRSIESKHLDVEAWRIAGENEWDALRIRQKLSAVPMKKCNKKAAAASGSEERIPTEQWARLTPLRNKFFSYDAYQDVAEKRKEFVVKLLKLRIFGESTTKEGLKLNIAARKAEHLKNCLKLFEIWGGGPYLQSNLE